jgi:tetratricopeptide (TPR) repeat protein
MDVTLVFKGVGIAKCIGEYLGIVESINSKIDRLSQSEFEAGMRALNQASKSGSEQNDLLREARNRFNKAISLEKNERLALAYLGLSLCHYHLQDLGNAKDALRDLLAVEIDYPIKSFATTNLISLLAIIFVPFYAGASLAGEAIESSLLDSRKKKLQELQECVEKILNSL